MYPPRTYVRPARASTTRRDALAAAAAGPPQPARAVHSRPLAHRRPTGAAQAASHHRLRQHALAAQRQQQHNLFISEELDRHDLTHHLPHRQRAGPLPKAAEAAEERRRGGDDGSLRLVERQRLCNECDPNGSGQIRWRGRAVGRARIRILQVPFAARGWRSTSSTSPS